MLCQLNQLNGIDIQPEDINKSKCSIDYASNRAIIDGG